MQTEDDSRLWVVTGAVDGELPHLILTFFDHPWRTTRTMMVDGTTMGKRKRFHRRALVVSSIRVREVIVRTNFRCEAPWDDRGVLALFSD
mmetsp:Transcript_16472/g.39428  ORF Transcript_16472/g.39428 Transcript_16472/m.39428 type:complete len:90 (-) Transcript_16472:322-591(-)